jgi:hypothetical protein
MDASLRVDRTDDRNGLKGREPETGLESRHERPADTILDPALPPFGNRIDHLG